MSFWGHEDVDSIDVAAVDAALEKGALLIDLGEPSEWMHGHIPGALLVEPELFEDELKKIEKTRPIIVAARNKELAEEVVGTIRARGYSAVVLRGGIAAWTNAGRKLAQP